MLDNSGDYHFHDGTILPTPGVCLLGPTMGATRFDLRGAGRVVGISLLPAGWIALHGGDASILTDRVQEMVDLPGYRDLLEQLRATDDAEEMARSEEHTSELQSLMRSSYAVFCLKKKKHEQ